MKSYIPIKWKSRAHTSKTNFILSNNYCYPLFCNKTTEYNKIPQ